MSTERELIDKLTTLNRIAGSLNRAVDVRAVLDRALADLVGLMGLESGWISLLEPSDSERPVDGEYRLAAHYNLPPALDPGNREVWQGSCTCRELANGGGLDGAYNEVHCSRLARASGDRHGLAVHASAPLRAGDRTLGILNVGAPDWASFSPEALSLLTTVGSQIGLALERAQLYDLLHERRAREQRVLLHFSTQLLRRLGFDDLMPYLTTEVREILRADACALLLPGEEPGTLEFRASSGWRVDPGAERRRVPADDTSGPGLVMRTRQPLLVEDLWAGDPSPLRPAWLQDEHFRGHAVVPLLVENRPVGVLVVDHREPRVLDQDDLHCLLLMANQAAIAVEKLRLHREVVKFETLEKELAVGRQIQLSMLPGSPPAIPGWEFATFYQPAREVGGDFYDFFPLPGADGRLGVVIGDVSGKGVPAALFMARGATLIRSAARWASDPVAALIETNDAILADRRFELFLTAFYGELDTRHGRVRFANAGHSRPLWKRAGSGQCEELATRGTLLGAFGQIELEECSVELAPGDLLVLYTDGVTEAMNADQDLFGRQRLHALLMNQADATAQQVLRAVVSAVQAHTGDVPQSDDITLVVVKRRPARDEGEIQPRRAVPYAGQSRTG